MNEIGCGWWGSKFKICKYDGVWLSGAEDRKR